MQVPVDVPKCLGHRAVQRAASRVPVGKQDSSANRYLLTQLKRIAHRLPTQTPHEQLMERRSNEGAGGKSVGSFFLGDIWGPHVLHEGGQAARRLPAYTAPTPSLIRKDAYSYLLGVIK